MRDVKPDECWQNQPKYESHSIRFEKLGIESNSRMERWKVDTESSNFIKKALSAPEHVTLSSGVAPSGTGFNFTA